MNKSVTLFADSLSVAMKRLNDEECGQLLRCILSYLNGEEIVASDKILDKFEPMQLQFGREQDRRASISDKRAKAAHSRWQNPNANASFAMQPLNNNDNNNDNNNKNTNDNKEKIEKEKPPTNEVEAEKSEEEKAFEANVRNEYPRISRMRKPLTFAQFKTLLKDFGEEVLKESMNNLENYSKLSNYISAYLTIRNWCKLEIQRHGTNRQPNQTTTGANIVNRILDDYTSS